jgi:hypothetical protein
MYFNPELLTVAISASFATAVVSLIAICVAMRKRYPTPDEVAAALGGGVARAMADIECEKERARLFCEARRDANPFLRDGKGWSLTRQGEMLLENYEEAKALAAEVGVIVPAKMDRPVVHVLLGPNGSIAPVGRPTPNGTPVEVVVSRNESTVGLAEALATLPKPTRRQRRRRKPVAFGGADRRGAV